MLKNRAVVHLLARPPPGGWTAGKEGEHSLPWGAPPPSDPPSTIELGPLSWRSQSALEGSSWLLGPGRLSCPLCARTLRITPAMAAGVTDHVWEIDDLLGE